MKRFFKTTILFVMVLTLLFTGAMVANAESDNGSKTGVTPYSNDYLGHYQNVSTSWKTIAKSTTGFNCNVLIECKSPSLAPLDIRMLGKNGNVIWSESGAVGGQGNRAFWCGNDVYTIQARSQSGTSSVYIQPW